MKKENKAVSVLNEPTARITRARAVAYCSSGGMFSSIPYAKYDQKQVLQRNSKRTALDENNPTAPVTTRLQHKRRAVLKDVANICCENSYRSCINAAKLPTKNWKQALKVYVKDTKIAPAIPLEIPQVQDNSKIKMAEETEKIGITELQEPKLLVKMGKNISVTQSISSSATERGVADTQLEKQMLEKPLLDLFASKKDKDEFFENSGSGQYIIDIDSDTKDLLMCNLYASDIHSNLRIAELSRRPCSNFIETVQQDITQSMRGILVDWLVEVNEECKLTPDTLYLTVYLIDQFLSQNYIERQKLQLLGITCMLIASKYEEICAPRVDEFCIITDNTYTRREVLKMEIQVLNNLGFQISTPTIKTFLRRFLRAAQASYNAPSLELEFLANYLAELTLVEYEFLKTLPSLTAASAVFLARWTLDQSGHPWNHTLEHYTSYKASDLKAIILSLQDLQMNAKGCPLNAIRDKYRQQKFKCVATFSSPKLLQLLFQNEHS